MKNEQTERKLRPSFGNYTGIVAGKNGATGVSLLEVYKVAVAGKPMKTKFKSSLCLVRYVLSRI